MQINLEKPVSELFKKITYRHILIALILTLTIISRLYGLGERVMSHDEVNHVVPAFDFYSGRGYRQDPVTHGPLQFHLMALSYFIFGNNDFTSRLPHALFSIGTVAFVLTYFRRYIGKAGSIAAGIFFAISPYMLFYGRYARNESICAFLGVVTLYLVLRFLEEGKNAHMLGIAIALALNFSAKETAYIFTAQLLIFLFILAVRDLFKLHWNDRSNLRDTTIFNLGAIIIVGAALAGSGLIFRRLNFSFQSGELNLLPMGSGTSITIASFWQSAAPLLRGLLPILLILFASIIYLLAFREKMHWETMSGSRAFQLLILTGTLVLPLLAAFPVALAGINPTAYNETLPLLSDYIYLIYFFALSLTIGFIWHPMGWWKPALAFFGIYLVLFTTFFTNSMGVLTGLIGSLGHWVSQQEVQRGGQPLYYYALIQIPVYEFLGAFGTLLALAIGLRKKTFWSRGNSELQLQSTASLPLLPNPAIFIFWGITSLIAYSFAGEKMPWLTVHIAFSMLLAAGWATNWLISKQVNVIEDPKSRLLSFGAMLLFIFLLGLLVVQAIGSHAPFQGKTQEQLNNTNHFIMLFLFSAGSVYLICFQEKRINGKKLILQSLLAMLSIFSIITARSAYRANYINYDYPYEYLVYAHAADDPKIVLEQIEEISRRLTGGKDIKVAYDNHGLYPYWWYLRDYPNKIVYLENPSRSLEEAELIIAGSDKYSQIDAIVRDNYYSVEYMRLWWPMQDYFNLTWERISSALGNARMREALFKIWMNRDYTLYAEVTDNRFLTLGNWLPSERMRFYVRNDVAAKMWQLNTEGGIQQEFSSDPYAEKTISRQADFIIGRSGISEGELNTPHGLDIGADGSIYVADSNNHRILKFSPDGSLLESWGSHANILEDSAPGGTLNEPWDVAVGADGSIFIADTFNHRIQKWSANGRFLRMWGFFAQGDDPQNLWGPRGIAIDPSGNLLVTDTGNKRVLVFDKNLNFITQFGGVGFEAGQLDEPVGITVSGSGQVAVADTWNRRVQIFVPDETGLIYTQAGAFDVDAWYGTGVDNKPYLTFSPDNTILISDPEGNQVLEFSVDGEFIKGWKDLVLSEELYSRPYGLDFDAQGNLWVSEAASNAVLRFNITDDK